VSHARVFDPPTPVLEAFAAIESLLASPSLRLLVPGAGYFELLRRMLACGASGNLVFDAQIAAVCLEHGARTLLTEDKDFTRFTGLTIQALADFGS
jgi:predicted nucleic acid-binding protein